MTLPEALLSVWRQVLVEEKDAVELQGDSFPVELSRRKKLRTVEFRYGGRELVGLEQNPQTQSRWAQLARRGKRVMQFTCEGRYFANVVEGRLTRYPAWHALRLPT